ncbi:amino acid transport GAP1 [Fusarium circinatum]|uniref:Amino acid transport GAP1 n=1 Tax=Fusarium circinatum TaxID=48490 RepID=A0A8H5X010_FUSCI|nr:amino acid transport GAP1 [Fusarium circinatum]
MGNGHIVLTHDVEVIEMKDVGVGTSWDVSTKPAEEPASWFEGFQRAKRRRDKTYDHGYCPNPKPVAELGQYDIAAANAKTVTTPLARELKGRHLQMIAFGGSIGKFLKLMIGKKEKEF